MPKSKSITKLLYALAFSCLRQDVIDYVRNIINAYGWF